MLHIKQQQRKGTKAMAITEQTILVTGPRKKTQHTKQKQEKIYR